MSKNKTSPQDFRFEMEFYENVLKYSPDFVEALTVLAELYTRAGSYEKGLALDQHLAKLRPNEPTIQYNLACSLSLTGDVPGAFEAMKRALDNGYDDFSYLEKDQDLFNLHSYPFFQDYYRQRKIKSPVSSDKNI